MIPYLISGDTTELQKVDLENVLREAVQDACRAVVGELDSRAADSVLKAREQIQAELTQAIGVILRRNSFSDKFRDEVVASTCVYPPSYRARPIEAQVSDLRRIFPSLGSCMEKLARAALPEGPEDWFAIPRWQAVAPTYGEAVDLAVAALATRRKFSHRLLDRTGPAYLRPIDRSNMALKVLAEQQPGQDILVLAAQFGMLHRGSSARRARVTMAGHEFGLGVFAIACMLLTHPERLSGGQTLMLDCSGDEYSLRNDSTFDRVPLFDLDIGGIEFSVFYENRAWNLWGTPSGFLYQQD